ncbi:MAG: hypothetical protein J7L11_03205 [Thermoprotei archaeon]|nr:hypothetical protein [Thermoprotei archaeon]
MGERDEFRTGITWRSILALVLAGIIFIPISNYLYLVLGSGMGGTSTFFITMLFVELTSLSYAPLTPQETLMVYYGTGIGGYTSPYYLVVYRSYFVRSPFAWSAHIEGKPLAMWVPSWLTPPYYSKAHALRTLFTPEFLLPVGIYTVRLVLSLIAQLAIAMLMARIYVEFEKYRFPFAQVDVSMVKFLSERDPSMVKVILISMVAGVAYAIVAYASPILTGVRIIPLPFYDMTWLVQDYLPGAALGLSTVLSAYVGPFIIPFNTAIWIFIASSIVWIFLNSLFITTFPNFFPEWVQEYHKGMGLIAIQNRSFIRVWFVPQVGFGLALALYMIYRARRGIVSIFRALRITEKGELLDFPSNWVLIIAYLASTGVAVLIHHMLIPDLPIWVPAFAGIAYSFLLAIAYTAILGEVGFLPAAPPFVWQTLVYLTPYKGYAGFVFEPTEYTSVGLAAPGFAQQTKVALTLKAKPSDLVKLILIASPLAWFMGLISLEIFWRIAPIPSAVYPNTVYGMPLSAQIDVVTAGRQLRVTPEYLFYPTLGVLAILFAGDLLLKVVKIPIFSPIGFVMGLYTQPAGAIAMLIGSALGTFVMPRLVGGREVWDRIRGYVIAGEMIGEGMVLTLLLAVSMMAKSAWLWPW